MDGKFPESIMVYFKIGKKTHSAGLKVNPDQKAIQQNIQEETMLINQPLEVLEKDQDSPEELDDLLPVKVSSCICGSSTPQLPSCIFQ